MQYLINRWTYKLQTLQVHRSYDEEDTGQHKAKVKSEKMYLLVNVSPPEPLDVATSNFADGLVRS